MKYGSANLTGIIYNDKVCSSDQCVNDFQFMAIDHQEGLSGLDGILGLGPNTNDGDISYLMELKKNGLI